MELNQEQANILINKWATILLINAPPFIEFGIDNQCWQGIKLIPPGAHYIYYALQDEAYAKRTGIFIHLKEKEIYVRKWSNKRQAFETLLKEDEEAYTSGVKSHEFDAYLGPYPMTQYKQWVGSSSFITQNVISRINPVETTQVNEKNEYNRRKLNVVKEVDEEGEEKETVQKQQPIDEVSGKRYFFIDVPKHHIKHKATPEELTMLNYDKTKLLREKMGGLTFEDILGELQYSFVGFVVGNDADCLEQWEKLVDLLCNVNTIIQESPVQYSLFIMALRRQLKQFPSDFFFDNITKDSFMRKALHNLHEEVNDSKDIAIQKESNKLFKMLQKAFKFDASDSNLLSD